ncbi:hypothetical protein ABVK25_000542 [Lepraria finkii]|uniref:Uncharacterized protein n=1 Tax=Lepraria finkii TaxID=1340010 RepID=A0ABR4BNG2_9LECA
MIPLYDQVLPQTDNAFYFRQGHHQAPLDRFLSWIIAAFPALVALCALLVRGCRPLLPYRPTWAKPFIEELKEDWKIINHDNKKHIARSTTALLVLVPIGLTLQVVKVAYPSFDQAALLLAVAWAIATLLVAIDRPMTAPVGLLVIIISVLAAQAVLLIKARSNIQIHDVLAVFEIVLAIIAIAIIICMPLRDPQLPNQDISPVYEIPTGELRSPEDNLTLWQFMTVSWMSPLMSLGSVRQLNDEDVWSLSLEFQHRGLHDKFRELKGSVVRRLLTANGIDLIIISLLGILESIASTRSEHNQLYKGEY